MCVSYEKTKNEGSKKKSLVKHTQNFVSVSAIKPLSNPDARINYISVRDFVDKCFAVYGKGIFAYAQNHPPVYIHLKSLFWENKDSDDMLLNVYNPEEEILLTYPMDNDVDSLWLTTIIKKTDPKLNSRIMYSTDNLDEVIKNAGK